MFKVSYLHGQGYRVSRTFDTQEDAQEFIDVNAMVFPLPGVEMTEILTCQYSARHAMDAIPATTTIDCGPVGTVATCQACADFYARMA